MADVQYVIFRLEDEYYGADTKHTETSFLKPNKVPNNLTSLKGYNYRK